MGTRDSRTAVVVRAKKIRITVPPYLELEGI
jgi:hypothetical protein